MLLYDNNEEIKKTRDANLVSLSGHARMREGSLLMLLKIKYVFRSIF